MSTERERTRLWAQSNEASANQDVAALLAFANADFDLMTLDDLGILVENLEQAVGGVTINAAGQHESPVLWTETLSGAPDDAKARAPRRRDRPSSPILVFAPQNAPRIAELRRRPGREAFLRRLRDLQRRFREALHPSACVPGIEHPSESIFIPRGTEIVFVANPSHAHAAPMISIRTKNFEAAFWLKVASLFTTHATEIRACSSESCRRLFMRHRKQTFCSPACSQRERSRKSYAKHRRARLRQARARRKAESGRAEPHRSANSHRK